MFTLLARAFGLTQCRSVYVLFLCVVFRLHFRLVDTKLCFIFDREIDRDRLSFFSILGNMNSEQWNLNPFGTRCVFYTLRSI